MNLIQNFTRSQSREANTGETRSLCWFLSALALLHFGSAWHYSANYLDILLITHYNNLVNDKSMDKFFSITLGEDAPNLDKFTVVKNWWMVEWHRCFSKTTACVLPLWHCVNTHLNSDQQNANFYRGLKISSSSTDD